jgi:hypothetical protein
MFAMAIAWASGGACGMNDAASKSGHCRVIDGEKLPRELGGEQALCAAIAQALGPDVANRAAIEVSVISPYLLSATVIMTDGRRLPAVKVGSSDRPLGSRAVQMLADSIAVQVAAQQKQN